MELTQPRPTGSKSKLSNGRTVTNLASYNFYNFVGNDHIKEKAIQTLRTYGVGPCGPPQFYGTQDVHMKTEADIASCLGTEGCIVYAQAFSTISSVIPAFCKRGDIIVADRSVNFSIRKGLQICRSTIKYFEHNDMEDLERVLQKVVKDGAKKPLTRRFIVTEGLSEAVGDCVDLPKLVSVTLSDHTSVTNTCRLNSNFDTNSALCSTRRGPSEFSAGQAGASRKLRMLTLRKLTCSLALLPVLSVPVVVSALVLPTWLSTSAYRLHPTRSLRLCPPC